MAEDNTETTGLSAANKTGIVWAITIAFIAINVFVVLISMLTPFGAERLTSISEIFFWFDMSCILIIAQYYGLNIVSYIQTFRKR